MKNFNLISRLVAGALLLGASAAVVAADTYPAKPIHFVLPVPPGNAGDITARVLAEQLSKNIGQVVVVDNRPGAGGNIGAELVAKAAPDGYTVLLGSSGVFTTNDYLYDLPFDPHSDFIPITMTYSGAPMLVVNTETGPETIQELVASAQEEPDKLSFASYGIGHISHILGEKFKTAAELNIFHVPYTNSPLTDLMAGRVTMLFASPLVAVSNTDRLRILGVVSAERNPKMPDVPALAEFYPGFEMTGWQGAFVPKGTPPEVVSFLHRELVKVITSPEFKQRMDDQMLDIGGNSSEEFAAYIRSASEAVGEVVRTANIEAK